MAKPLTADDFPQANDVLQAAPGTESQVSDLAIFRQAWPHVLEVYNLHRERQGLPPANFPQGPTCVISKWAFTPEEMAEISRTGCIYLQFMGGTHSPVSVWGTSPWAPATPEPAPEPVGDYISPEDARREEDDGPEINAK